MLLEQRLILHPWQLHWFSMHGIDCAAVHQLEESLDQLIQQRWSYRLRVSAPSLTPFLKVRNIILASSYFRVLHISTDTLPAWELERSVMGFFSCVSDAKCGGI
jgi:hypothetical protein